MKEQIEEIAKVLLQDCEGACTDCEYYGRYDGSVCIPMRLANSIYIAGYRKQSEGEWLEIDDGVLIGDGKHLECSECGVWKKDRQRSNFCSNCGAKMKGDKNEQREAD